MGSKDYFSDLEGFGSGPALPSFSESTFPTPRVSMSRRSSRPSTTTRGGGSSSPPPLPSSTSSPLAASTPVTQTDKSDDLEYANNNEEVLTDPRRFTPTLHASLVSEILKLRGELDSRHKFIEDLETNLKMARDERDELKDSLSKSEKDTRSMKRQFQQLEHGTLAALEELAKDRDDAKSTSADLRTKLEAAHKKIKTHEDDVERRHAIWEKEKHSWEAEKRGFERRVHITETRLKTVLEELAAHHAAAQLHETGLDHEDEDNTKDSGVGDESDTASIQNSPSRNGAHSRSMSNSSRRSFNRLYRFSTQSLAGHDIQKFNGMSLADELQLDEEDEDEYDEAGDEEQEYHEQDKTQRPIESRLSQHHDDKAKRVLGIHPERRGTLQNAIDLDPQESAGLTGTVDQRSITPSEPRVPYVDSGVQYSPPASPVAVPVQKDLEKVPDVIPAINEDQIEANQRKKRVAPSAPLVDRGQQMSPVPEKEPTVMVNTASQTMEDRPLSPPATPKITPPDSPAEAKSPPTKPDMFSISTQTEPIEEEKSPVPVVSITHVAPSAPVQIPSIAIHPPVSRSPSPIERETVLPPGTKNVSCQTTGGLYKMTSTAVQTEEILTQKRLQKLPAHLLPSFISSNPPTPEAANKRSVSDKSPAPKASSERMSSPPVASPAKIEQRYPGNNDNGPLVNGEKSEGPRRPFRNSSLFAGFTEDENEMDSIDEDKSPAYQTPAMSNRIMKSLRHFSSRPSPVPEDKEVETKPRLAEALAHTESSAAAARGSSENRASSEKGKMPMRGGTMSRQSNSIRRSALIQSGAAVHRSRTPSVTSVGSSFFSNNSVGPPFPVPDRASSRKLFPQSKSEGSSSPTPRGAGLFGGRRNGSTRRDYQRHDRKDSLRKVRSATVIQRTNSGRRTRSRSPPSLGEPSSPTFPPLPKDHIAVPAKIYASQRSNEKSLSKDLGISPQSQLYPEQPSQGTVIDAIAGAMVGEWMWKYVRRRKSFGVSESPQDAMGRPGTDGSVNVTGNGVRHKRWVWLSPYERAVMWSTKQPASNSALMGKSGRKLVIQSVLDVRDDTPLPKNHGIAEPFYRSILILTPARALKFTAMSSDRHYSWLTALSFLAHSPLLAPGLASLPIPPEEPEPEESSRAPSLRRSAIRDSVRIAKDKARPQPGARLNGTGTRASSAIHEISSPVPSIPHSIPAVPIVDNGDMDAAEAPSVPRFAHGRKRSATGPRLPSSATRSMAYREMVSPSLPSAASSEYVITSNRSSEVSSGNRFNFFDDGGTVRMQAFVDGLDSVGRSSQDSSVILGARRRNSRWSGASSDPRRSGVVYGEEFDTFDPFRGF